MSLLAWKRLWTPENLHSSHHAISCNNAFFLKAEQIKEKGLKQNLETTGCHTESYLRLLFYQSFLLVLLSSSDTCSHLQVFQAERCRMPSGLMSETFKVCVTQFYKRILRKEEKTGLFPLLPLQHPEVLLCISPSKFKLRR